MSHYNDLQHLHLIQSIGEEIFDEKITRKELKAIL